MTPSKKAKKRPRKAAKKKPTAERKDHVLQTRVPESLYDDLVDQARRLRVPVSNLVRNILEDSIRIVENIVDGGLDIAEALANRASDEDLAQAVGWQLMTTGRRIPCARCGTSIEKGAQAFTSVGVPGGKTFVICGECQCKL
jgi:hypothetical protein